MECCKIRKSEYPYINHEEAAKFCHPKDMKCAHKVYTKLQMRNANAQKKALKILEKHMKSSLGPAWFQELSMNQIAAANMLFAAVGFDGIHCQLMRVTPVLKRINIHPLPKRHQLVNALKFARGSDLAFLWFLYNRVYRSSNDVCAQQHYTLNERLILSCICHLDMLLTLREMERILPKVESKKKIMVKVKKHKIKVEKKIYETPYDEPLSRSRFPAKENIKRPVRPQPKFKIYEMYKDPYYIIENEVNRWFTTSSLMPTEGECISQKIIFDQANETVKVKSKSKNLCKKHQDESSQFYKMMKKILNSNEEINEAEFSHLNSFEQGIVQGIKRELASAEKEIQSHEDEKHKRIIVKTVLRQIVESAVDIRFIHLCDKCEECLKSRQIFYEILEEKEGVNKKISKTSIASSIIQYCHRPTPYGPLTFDYGKIFATNFLEDNGAIQNSINTALEMEKHLTEDNAITVCLRDMWQMEMRLWEEKCRSGAMDREQKVICEVEEVWGNKKKILKLLEDAIGILRRNPKFVLAALPDSHRLPLLREWILQKYGVRHTDEEERKKLKLNKEQREILISTGIVPRVKVPTYECFGIKKPLMTYDEVINFKKKREKWLRKFEAKLASGCVNRCRIFYATTEPYLCNNFEDNRMMFYAYLPGVHREVDQRIMNEDIF